MEKLKMNLCLRKNYPKKLNHLKNIWFWRLSKRRADVILIKEQMGHDYIESTMIYLTCFPERIKSEFEIYKPSYI